MQNINHPTIVSKEDWLVARRQLLQEEKRLTRLRDQLSAKRRKLPWVKVDKPYRFDSPEGEKSLTDLFGANRQLVIKHFMMGPGWREGCVGCSFEADHIEAAIVHLEHHDISVVAVSRAPMAEIEAFKQRMGWHIPWVSSQSSDFNYDYHVSFRQAEIDSGSVYYNYQNTTPVIDEMSGISVFYKDPQDNIFHTYSAYGRGAEEILSTYMILDLTPLGRNENGPNGNLTDWVRHHDRYEDSGYVSATGRFVADDCCGKSGPSIR